MLSSLFVLLLAACALISDLLTDKISNAISLCGALAGFSLAAGGAVLCGNSFPDAALRALAAVLFALAGAAVPFVFGFPLFRFRMIGAGDVKFLMAVGVLTGPIQILKFMAVSIAFGGVIAALLMIFVTGVRPRLIRFASYIKMAEMTGSAPPYRDSKEAEFHFTVPVFMAAVLLFAGCF